MAKRTFVDWLAELREITRDQLEVELDELPEFDMTDARSYARDGSSPSLYFKECLSERPEEGDTIADIMREL